MAQFRAISATIAHSTDEYGHFTLGANQKKAPAKAGAPNSLFMTTASGAQDNRLNDRPAAPNRLRGLLDDARNDNFNSLVIVAIFV